MPRRGVAELQFHIAHLHQPRGTVREKGNLGRHLLREAQHIRRVSSGGLQPGLPVADGEGLAVGEGDSVGGGVEFLVGVGETGDVGEGGVGAGVVGAGVGGAVGGGVVGVTGLGVGFSFTSFSASSLAFLSSSACRASSAFFASASSSVGS